ncbi:hypothetical protein ABK040_005421 [Willaertia magna]
MLKRAGSSVTKVNQFKCISPNHYSLLSYSLQSPNQPQKEKHHGVFNRIFHSISEYVGMKILHSSAVWVEKSLTKRFGKKVTLKTAEKIIYKSSKRIGAKVVKRIGRGFVLSVPLVGGILAVLAFKEDYSRSQLEYKNYLSTENDTKKTYLKIYKNFLLASSFNGIDALIQTSMIYFYLTQENTDQKEQSDSIIEIIKTLPTMIIENPTGIETILSCLEISSIGCAIFATLFACIGETYATQLDMINEQVKNNDEEITDNLNNA